MIMGASMGVPATIVGEPDLVSRFAIVEDGVVANVVNWDGKQELPAELHLIAVPDDVGVGWDYVDGEFVDNRPRGHQSPDGWVEDVDVDPDEVQVDPA